MGKNKKIVYEMILFVLSILYLCLYLRPLVTGFDENYTLNLIKNNCKNLIYLDSIDVHPPLYYFLVKFFINITTFWTSYLPIKVISARLFSVLISVITFIFLRLITFRLHIKNSILVQWIIIIILPNTLGPKVFYQSFVNIRMYSLAALFIVIEFYMLLMFYKTNSNVSLIIATLCSILATYTHYYAAMFGGLLLLIYFIKYINNNNPINAIKVFIAGLILIVSFIPWCPIFIHQMNSPATYWMSNLSEIKNTIVFLVVILIFAYPILSYYKDGGNKLFNDQILIVISLISIVFIFSMIFTLLKGHIFQFKYMYPLMIIYEFLSLDVALKFYKKYNMTIVIVFMLLCIILLSSVWQIKRDIHSANLIKTYEVWQGTSSKSIKMNKVDSRNGDNSNNYTFYMSFINKRFIISKKDYKDHYSYIYHYKKLFNNNIKRIKFK